MRAAVCAVERERMRRAAGSAIVGATAPLHLLVCLVVMMVVLHGETLGKRRIETEMHARGGRRADAFSPRSERKIRSRSDVHTPLA